MKNYERIRNMSIEDLALVIMCPEDSKRTDSDLFCPSTVNCYKCVLEWLMKEEDDNAE